jgi:O-antigen/teichoic acid export membrane protein
LGAQGDQRAFLLRLSWAPGLSRLLALGRCGPTAAQDEVRMLRALRSKLGSRASLLAGNAVDTILPLFRSVVLAHLLVKEEFGLAIVIAAASGMVETMADFGLQYSAVRCPNSIAQDRYCATLHSVLLIRAAMLCVVLAAAAPILVWLLGQWHILWAFWVLAGIVLLRGFGNLSIYERQRVYVYWPVALAYSSSQLAWTIVTIATAWIFRDYSSMVWGLVGSLITYLILSHLFAARRWRLGWDKTAAQEIISYGRPLIPNGVANAIATQGDRFVVGSALGTAALAVWNVTMATSVLPRGMIVRVLIGVFMPVFVNRGTADAKQTRLFDRWAACLSLIVTGYALGLIAFGRPVLGLVFGAAYQPTPLLMNLVAIVTCIKFFTCLPVPPALAFGHTRLVLWNSVSSALSLAVAATWIPWLRSLESFIMVLAATDFIALSWILMRSVSMYGFSRPLLYALVLIPLVALCALALLHHLVPTLGLLTWIALCCAAGLVVLGLIFLVLHRSGLPPSKLVVAGKS